MKFLKFIYTLILLFVCTKGNCCSCRTVDIMDVKVFESYNLICTGIVLKVYEKDLQRIIIMKIDRLYKGSIRTKTVGIYTPRQEGMCGIFPKKGERWLMFAYGRKQYYETNLCTRSKTLNAKDKDYNKNDVESDLNFLEKQ